MLLFLHLGPCFSSSGCLFLACCPSSCFMLNGQRVPCCSKTPALFCSPKSCWHCVSCNTKTSKASMKQTQCGQAAWSNPVNNDETHWKVTGHTRDKQKLLFQSSEVSLYFFIQVKVLSFNVTSTAIHLKGSSLPTNASLAALSSVDLSITKNKFKTLIIIHDLLLQTLTITNSGSLKNVALK